MQLFYSPDIQETDSQYTFNKEESKHIVKVLRKKEGDPLYITNGKGFLFTCTIDIADLKNCLVSINKAAKQNKRGYQIHIAIAPTKMNDRMEWFLEKAVEIGIDEITPIICDNSERKVIKPERFEKIILSATKQSLQYYLPQLNKLKSFKEFVSLQNNSQKFIAHCEKQDKRELFTEIKPDNNYTVLIGPEGDFSTKEIELALKNNFTPVSLGNTRLRTETAGIVACHTVALKNNY